jgi:pilus assembly protein CpaB
VLAIDQLADARTEKPSVVKAVTLEVNVTDGQKIALAATVGTLSLLLNKAGEGADTETRRISSGDLGKPTEPAPNSRFVTVGVIRPGKNLRTEYTVPIEHVDGPSAALPHAGPAHD